jgi:hypothetical protein
LALGLFGLAYVFYAAKIIPDTTTKWGLFAFLITLELASCLVAFGIILLLLVVIEECCKPITNQIHLVLQEAAYQQYDLTGSVLMKLQEQPNLDISAQNIKVISTDWDAEDGKFTLVLGQEIDNSDKKEEGEQNQQKGKEIQFFGREIITDSRGNILTIQPWQKDVREK